MKKKKYPSKTKCKKRLFDMQGCSCFYCGTPLDENNWSQEHVIPKHMGGALIVWACIDCNLKKGDSLPTELDVALARVYRSALAVKDSQCRIVKLRGRVKL